MGNIMGSRILLSLVGLGKYRGKKLPNNSGGFYPNCPNRQRIHRVSIISDLVHRSDGCCARTVWFCSRGAVVYFLRLPKEKMRLTVFTGKPQTVRASIAADPIAPATRGSSGKSSGKSSGSSSRGPHPSHRAALGPVFFEVAQRGCPGGA